MLSGSVVYDIVHPSIRETAAKHESLKHHVAKASKTTSSSSKTPSTSDSGGTSSTGSPPDFAPGRVIDTITFSQAPAAVQTGLRKLAAGESLAAPTSAQSVYLGNFNGIESYTLDYTASGTTSQDAVLTGGWGGADFGAVDFGMASFGGGRQ